MSHWHLGIYLIFVPALIVLANETQRRFLFGYSSLLSLVPQNYFRPDLRWNVSAGASELIPFGARSDRLWDLQSPDIPFWVFLLVSLCWVLPWLFVCRELNFSILLLSWGNPCIIFLIILLISIRVNQILPWGVYSFLGLHKGFKCLRFCFFARCCLLHQELN